MRGRIPSRQATTRRPPSGGEDVEAPDRVRGEAHRARAVHEGLFVPRALPGDGRFRDRGDEVGEDVVQPGAALALAWDLSRRFSLGSNLRYRYASADGERFEDVGASAKTAVDENSDAPADSVDEGVQAV